MILTNPENPSQTFNTDNPQSRGRPSTWLLKHPDYIAWKSSKIIPQEVIPEVKENTLNIWKYFGLSSDDKRMDYVGINILVAAQHAGQAIRILGKRFKDFPVSKIEFETMWKPVENTLITSEGVYEVVDNVLVRTVS